jgi:spermidine synthase
MMSRPARCARLAARVAALAAFAFAGLAAAADLKLLHEERSLYRQVLVYQDQGNRCLCFTRQCTIGRQSCQSLAHPDRLVFAYGKMMLGSLLMAPAPKHVLVIGLGGGTLPRALLKLVPGVDIDVVEIDPAVVRVASNYFDFNAGPQVHVIVEDGRTFVKRMGRAGKHYDLVMLDAYDHQYIPEHMLTVEFLQEVKALLPPGGVLAANTFSASRLYDNESVTYAKVFGEFFNLRSGNRIILARIGGLPPIAEVRAAAVRYEQAFAPLGFAGAEVLELMPGRADWDRGARLLTDQYSPANLLNAPR